MDYLTPFSSRQIFYVFYTGIKYLQLLLVIVSLWAKSNVYPFGHVTLSNIVILTCIANKSYLISSIIRVKENKSSVETENNGN